MAGGLCISAAIVYDIVSLGLPSNVDDWISTFWFSSLSIAMIYFGAKQKYDPIKYEVIKISQYGTRTYGPYDTYAEAEVAVQKFGENLFDESFYEIKVVSAAKYDGDHQRELDVKMRSLIILLSALVFVGTAYAEEKRRFIVIVVSDEIKLLDTRTPTAYLAVKGLHFGLEDKPAGDTYIFRSFEQCEAKLLQGLKFTPDTISKSVSPRNRTINLSIKKKNNNLNYHCEEVEYTPLN